jgi:hypothetical protein
MVQQNTAPAKDVTIIEFAWLVVLFENAAPEIGAQLPVAGMFGDADGCEQLAEFILGASREGGRRPHSVQGIAVRPDETTFGFDLTNLGVPGDEQLVYRTHGLNV